MAEEMFLDLSFLLQDHQLFPVRMRYYPHLEYMLQNRLQVLPSPDARYFFLENLFDLMHYGMMKAALCLALLFILCPLQIAEAGCSCQATYKVPKDAGDVTITKVHASTVQQLFGDMYMTLPYSVKWRGSKKIKAGHKAVCFHQKRQEDLLRIVQPSSQLRSLWTQLLLTEAHRTCYLLRS